MVEDQGWFQIRKEKSGNRMNVFFPAYRYMVGPGNKIFEMHYQLPSDLTCQQCVFQWRYIAGNNWGKYYSNRHRFFKENGPRTNYYLV